MEMLMESLQTVSPEDLALINQVARRELKAEEVYTFSAKFIDDEPTGNRNIYTREWQSSVVEQFVGLPVTVDHDLFNSEMVLGRIYKAEQIDNAIHGKVYVPLNSEVGRKAKDDIDSGRFKDVSILTRVFNTKREGVNARVMPHKDDRVFHVSFTPTPGCRTASVLKESIEAEPVQAEQVNLTEPPRLETIITKEADAWVNHARESHRQATADYIRLAAFVFGTDLDRRAYQAVAESCDPKTLQQLTADLRHLYDCGRDHVLSESISTTDVTEAIKQIRKMKGA